ncbi:coiled-coil domain-containing protein 18-like isoform X2 [Montipora foliosa]|uniref:coiled-coil domain-containing protein 18-like isoform X2 n=1 Tax=Montipora foliosa TaxID=591990 RepID=UPI0035F18325
MKKTPLSSRHAISPTSGHSKSRKADVKTNITGSAGDTFLDLKGTPSKSASRLGQSSFEKSHGSVNVKDRQLQKCYQELEQLKKENNEIRAELLYVKSLYKQLVEETALEKYDERRVNLLKSQVIQLERQILLQSCALQARRDVFVEVENKLLNLREALRSLYNSESPSNYLTLSRELVLNLEYKVEALRLNLHKRQESADSEDLALPVMFMGDFLKQTKHTVDQPVTLLDCCSGRVEHLNLKHVSRLESKLCKLYKNMICLKEAIQNQSSSTASAVLTSEHISQHIKERLTRHVRTVSDMLQDCSQDLLYLSLLYPAAPWPPLKKVAHEDLTEENIMSLMPDLSRKKLQEVRSVVQVVMRSITYLKHMLSLQIKILKEELSFHQQVYECQVDYVESLLSAVSEAYKEFESRLKELLCNPLEEILEAYKELKDTASEDSLKKFLSAFKDNAAKLSDALESVQSHSQQGERGVTALSEFHSHFLDSIQEITRNCVTKRDTIMKQLLETKDSGLNQTAASTACPETITSSAKGSASS